MNHAKILNLLISSLLLLSSIGFANSPETRDININPCLSTDPDIGDSAFWASKAVEQFADAKFTDAVSTVDACFAQWGPEAGQQQKKLHKKRNSCPPTGKVK
ncbi:MAG: hypothetical protein HN476_03490, partial [Porticoccaceae bacterium]|nr:hypothetical protein [Porticoccaceae bacterium]